MSYIGKVTAGGSTHLVGSTLYGTCATNAATAEKVVVCSDFDTLITGVTIHVKFTYSNTNATPTLNVNSTGAKSIYRYGTTKPSTSAGWSWYAGAIVSFTYDGSAWIMNDMIGNDNTFDREMYNGAVKADTAITAGFLTCGTSSGYHNVVKGASFDISYPVLYQGTAIAANATRTDFYQSIPFNFTTTNKGTSPAFTTYKAVYLKGTLSGSVFTIDSTTMWTQNVPTSEDGYIYYRLGIAYSATNIRLLHDHPLFWYKDGSFQLYGSADIPVVSKTKAGLAPQLPNETTTTKFLRQDGTWAEPSEGMTHTFLTDAEYEALSSSEKLDADVIYFTDDGSAAVDAKVVVQINQNNALTVPSSAVVYQLYQDFAYTVLGTLED